MSTRLEMLQVARLAPTMLGESADLVASFLLDQHNDDGGFADRAGRSDIYYSVFALEGLLALQRELPVERVRTWLTTFGDGEGLDLIHLACLARCWACINRDGLDDGVRQRIVRRVAAYRSGDGGFHQSEGEAQSTSYAIFVGWGAYQDLNEPLPGVRRFIDCLASLHDESGGYWNDAESAVPTAPTTAAAVTILRQLQADLDPQSADFLLLCFAEGGFRAIPAAPMPDLLSTAVVLHALSGMQVDCGRLKEPCLDFIDTLWTSRGGFHGTWADDELDAEYTYYGLLALGHLSVM